MAPRLRVQCHAAERVHRLRGHQARPARDQQARAVPDPGPAGRPAAGADHAEIVTAVSERERLGSTGFGNGVAIPHGKLPQLARIHCLVARLAEPIDYKAVDGQPVDLVFFLLSPPDAGADHLKALAALSRTVRHGPTLEKLRGARSRDALAAVLLGVDERDAA